MVTSNMMVRAHASPGVALLAVHAPSKIANLAGWAIKRKDVKTGEEVWLQSKVPFAGQTNPNYESRDTTEWPIQKPIWKNFNAPKDTLFQWGFVPVFFDKTSPTGVNPDLSQITWTDPITLTTVLDDEISVGFTNGFLAEQWIAHNAPRKADGSFDFDALIGMLNTPGNPLRVQQAGDALPLLMSAIQQARAEGGRCYAVLYELTDKELVGLICANPDLVTVILGNTGTNDAENHPFREQLKAAGVKVIDRFVPAEGIAHNKLIIYVNAKGEMCYVIAGSTNWTATGLCCQANTVIKVSSAALTTLYKKQIDLLTADSAMKPTQSEWLRSRFAVKPPVVVLKSGARVQVFFTPNTQDKIKPKAPHPLPLDRAFGSALFRQVEEMLTALFFMPGTPSYLDDIRWLQENSPNLAVLEVAVNSYQALQKGDVLLQHRPGQPSVAVVASAIEKAFGDYLAEILLLPGAHAVIHTKAACGDARHKNRWKVWVMIGSHNGGDKASYSNDENVLFICGHRALAIAVMVNHMDVTDHYRFRMMVDQNSNNGVLQGFLANDDTWQDPYYVDGARMRELEYLTRPDQPEEDGPIPDCFQEDPDPNAVANWGNVGVDWPASATTAAEPEAPAGAKPAPTEPKSEARPTAAGEHTAPPKHKSEAAPSATVEHTAPPARKPEGHPAGAAAPVKAPERKPTPAAKSEHPLCRLARAALSLVWPPKGN